MKGVRGKGSQRGAKKVNMVLYAYEEQFYAVAAPHVLQTAREKAMELFRFPELPLFSTTSRSGVRFIIANSAIWQHLIQKGGAEELIIDIVPTEFDPTAGGKREREIEITQGDVSGGGGVGETVTEQRRDKGKGRRIEIDLRNEEDEDAEDFVALAASEEDVKPDIPVKKSKSHKSRKVIPTPPPALSSSESGEGSESEL